MFAGCPCPWSFGKGIAHDIRSRLPYYADDWRQGLSFKVLSATVYMFFSNVLPAVTFALILDERTQGAQGVFEVLLSMALGGTLFAIFAGQPLVIVGVTGPVSIFCATVHDLTVSAGLDYLGFMFWVSLWAAVMHVLLAGFGACSAVKLVTPFSGEIFGMLISVIYAYTGSAELARQLGGGARADAALLALILAALTFSLSYLFARAHSWHIGTRLLRTVLADYGPVIAVVSASAAQFLPAFAPDFGPSIPRAWVPSFWAVPSWAIGAALGPAAFLTALLFFGHNISSYLAQAPERGLKKPSAYHWDFALLGISVLLTGVLGLPPNYGLIPQAPLHVRALADIDKITAGGQRREVWRQVRETRASALGQSLLMLVLLTRPFLWLLSRVPTGVLAGQFLFLAVAGAQGSSLLERLRYLMLDRSVENTEGAAYAPLPYVVVAAFTVLQAILVIAIFLVTLSPAGVAFPILILALVPVRVYALPWIFSQASLTGIDCVNANDAPGSGDASTSEAVGFPRAMVQLDDVAGNGIPQRDSSLDAEDAAVVPEPLASMRPVADLPLAAISPDVDNVFDYGHQSGL